MDGQGRGFWVYEMGLMAVLEKCFCGSLSQGAINLSLMNCLWRHWCLLIQKPMSSGWWGCLTDRFWSDHPMDGEWGISKEALWWGGQVRILELGRDGLYLEGAGVWERGRAARIVH